MKKIIVSIAVLIVFISCSKDFIHKDNKNDFLVKKWRIITEISGNDTYPFKIDTLDYSKYKNVKKILDFKSDNTMIEYDKVNGVSSPDTKMNVFKSLWKFNDDSTMVGLKLYEVNGQIKEGLKFSFRWKIEKLTDSILKIKFQGRAGYVHWMFTPYKNNDI